MAVSPRGRLNPCSNGRCSARRGDSQEDQRISRSLNPCSNGRCSARCGEGCIIFRIISVLILVLMEDALRDRQTTRYNTALSVLILVLMEDALRAVRRNRKQRGARVLILVLMEDALRESTT